MPIKDNQAANAGHRSSARRIVKAFEGWLSQRRFSAVDHFLGQVEVNKLTSFELFSILAGCKPITGHLDRYEVFRQAAVQRIAATRGKVYASNLLRDL